MRGVRAHGHVHVKQHSYPFFISLRLSTAKAPIPILISHQ
jgi:hypothetical protein